MKMDNVEDRPVGYCEKCNRRYKQRLNIFENRNRIQSCICDKCVKSIRRF